MRQSDNQWHIPATTGCRLSSPTVYLRLLVYYSAMILSIDNIHRWIQSAWNYSLRLGQSYHVQQSKCSSLNSTVFSRFDTISAYVSVTVWSGSRVLAVFSQFGKTCTEVLSPNSRFLSSASYNTGDGRNLLILVLSCVRNLRKTK